VVRRSSFWQQYEGTYARQALIYHEDVTEISRALLQGQRIPSGYRPRFFTGAWRRQQ
jgi:hypothetical protein